MQSRYSGRHLTREVLLWAVALLWSIPFFFLIVISVKPTEELFASALSLPSRIDFSSYLGAWESGSMGRALLNSIVITGGSVLGLLALSSICAFTLARRPGRISGVMTVLFLLGLVLPSQLGLIPTYAVFKQLNLVGTYGGMIALYIASWMPMAVFLYVGFIRHLPRDYEEAAQIDGATITQTFWRVVFPLLRPITGTVAILTGMLIWNDFFNALIFLNGSDKTPLPVAVYSFVGEYATRWNFVFAAVTMSLLPALLFFGFAQRQLIQGFTGGVKG